MTALSDKVVLVTGASKGIGASIAAAVGHAGARVVAHYGNDREGAEHATHEIPSERRMLVGIDLARAGSSRVLWAEAAAWQGHIDVLINNAGVWLETPLEASDAAWDSTWAKIFQVNVFESANLIREATRHFVARGGGVLIVISSWVAERGSSSPTLTAYAASKAAIRAAAQTIANTHAKDGVLTYLIAPGIVDTHTSEIAVAAMGGKEAVASRLAMGEWVPPGEIGDLVAFLAAGTVRHMSGATLDVNGATYIR